MTTLETLGRFAAGLKADELPPRLGEAVTRCLIDLLGAACAGHGSGAARMVRAVAGPLFAAGPAWLWFSGRRLAAPGAALANAAAASAWDLDDGHRAAAGHPGAAIIPACLAAAQEAGASARELQAALVLGYEVACRVAAARDLARLPTMASGRWVAYGVAAAAGRLHGLDAAGLAQAMAVAGVLSPDLAAAGYSRLMGNLVKEGIPWATLTGLVAVSLAAHGFSGPLDILDHPDYYQAPGITAGLGGQWAIEQVYFKPYACCRWCHAAIDALLAIQDEQGLGADDIAEIQVHTFERALRLSNETDPATLEGAQYSLPFTLAVAAVEGAAGLLPLRPELLGREELVELAGRVRLEVDPELEAMFPERSPARVVVMTRSRGRHEHTVLDPLGDPANPLSTARLEEKFRALTAGLLSPSRQQALLARVHALEPEGLPPLLEELGRPLQPGE